MGLIDDGVLMAKFGSVLFLLFCALLALKLFCLVDAATRREDAFRAADKNKKSFWLVILGLAVVLDFFFGSLLGLFSIAGLIAAIVYLVDVRPALREVGGRRGGSSSQGPYGPW